MAETSPGPASTTDAPGTTAAPAAGPWPAASSFTDRGLTIDGIPAAELAERFGTPLIVIGEREVRDRMRAAREAFPRVAYAVKAFTAHAVIRLALDEGLDLLCASGGEVEACLRAGAPGSRLLLHGNVKDDDELALAVEHGVALVIADGSEELRRLDAIARDAGGVQRVLLRVIPEVEVQTHEAIATGHELSKFGTPLADAPAAAAFATSLPGIRLEGFHAHAGSQVLDPAPFVRVLETLVALAATVRAETGVVASTIDVGGGFGVTYVDEPALALAEVGRTLRTRLDELAGAHGLPLPSLVVEPGRSIVANAAVTLYRVAARKRVGDGRKLVAVDGGMSDNLRPMLYDADYAVAPAGPADGPREHVTIVGRHCESGDVLAGDVEMPVDLARGDLVAFAATGAYGYSLASSYNRVGRPAVVAVRDGAAVTLLRREDVGDLDRLEVPSARVPIDAVAPPENVVVRPARPGDATSYLALWHGVVAEGRWVRTEEARSPGYVYRRRFRRSWGPEAADILAVEGSRVIGHLGASRERHPAVRHVATLGLAVADDRRGAGVGSALLSASIRWAREVGVHKLVLSVYPSNAAAVALYRKFGFVEEGRLSRQSRKAYGYEDEILMACWVGEDG